MKKFFLIIFVITMFLITSIILLPNNKIYTVKSVLSPVVINLGNKNLNIKTYECFDAEFSDKNKILAEKLNISETEAFILGNLGKYWANSLLQGRHVYITENDLIYLKLNYKEKFIYSGFCLKNGKPCYQEGFEKRLNDIRKTEYKVLDLDTENVYDMDDTNIKDLKNFIVIKKIHLPRKISKKDKDEKLTEIKRFTNIGDVKIFFTDSTTKIKPDRNCNSSICREILANIKETKETIDIAIYGYSRTPEIEEALKSALKRGVKIRLVYDSDPKGDNIYPDTSIITKLLANNMSDKNSEEVKNIMHNKFYIFDKKILITGSANLSHTDMSGFNSNSIVVINSPAIAKIYLQEFENMFAGNFHNSKPVILNKKINVSGTDIDIYFSPKDKSIQKAVIPLINRAQKYIYIPAFVLTDQSVANALINAKNRGVDVKIIIDALNASIKHSKHNVLRNGGVLVKTENYAGKMHSKSMIIDDKYTIIGSMNFSYSGENKNDENLLVIKNHQITEFYKDFFLYQWNRIDDKWLKYNARAEGKDSIGSCSDGIDNNYDGLTDHDDLACR